MKPCVPLLGLMLLASPLLAAPGPVPRVRVEMVFNRPRASAVPLVFTAREIAAALLAETNRVRVLHGCRPLAPLAKLNAAADDQLAYMALTMRATHDSPIRGQRDPRERVVRHGLRPTLVAENLLFGNFAGRSEPPATCAALAAEFVAQWLDSPVHRRNLLSPEMTHLGCATRRANGPDGTERLYSAQVFAAF